MPKRKSNTEVKIITNKKSLKDITGIDKDFTGIDKDLTTADKESQTVEFLNSDGFFEDETNHYLLLEIVANKLESSDIIIKSVYETILDINALLLLTLDFYFLPMFYY